MSTVPILLKEAMRLMRSDPARAAVLCRAAIEADPALGDAKLLLSEALRRMGDLGAAHALIAPLAAANPVWFGAQRQLGVILAESGQPVAAALALKAAADAAPAHPTIWRDLADQLALAGDRAGAEAAYVRHAEVGLAEPRLQRAAAALRAEDVEAAEAILVPFLKEHPTDVVAIRLRSEARARADRPDEAEALLRQALALAPGFRFARHALGQLLIGLGRLEEALAEANQLALRHPGHAPTLRLLAGVYMAMSEYARAAEIYEGLLKSQRDHAPTWLSYGHALKTLGRTDEGVNAYRKCVALAPGKGESYWSLANLKTARFGDDDIAAIRNQLARADLGDEDRVQLHYALGKALEDAGDVDAAFESYAEGAALQRTLVNYDGERIAASIDEACARFTAETFAARAGAGCPRRDPIFIVGLPRAGSTLVEQILASHSVVEGTAELPDIGMIRQSLLDPAEATQRSYFDPLLQQSPDELAAMGERYLQSTRVYRKLGTPIFIDKNPSNFHHVALIHLILPNARIVDARRHPMACGWSCFKQYFALGQNFTYDLREIGSYYRGYVKLMAHWDAVLPGRVHRVIHEDLARDPEPHIRALLDYCGLPFEDQCLRPHETQRAVRTPSSEQVRRPISAKGLEDWRAFEPYLGPLKDALGDALGDWDRQSAVGSPQS
jgi:predicted Zn-dependent protease